MWVGGRDGMGWKPLVLCLCLRPGPASTRPRCCALLTRFVPQPPDTRLALMPSPAASSKKGRKSRGRAQPRSGRSERHALIHRRRRQKPENGPGLVGYTAQRGVEGIQGDAGRSGIQWHMAPKVLLRHSGVLSTLILRSEADLSPCPGHGKLI
ncbi:hypothetical protein C8T65DRAFT_19357 [Cerioporus squamosus]|nr:hypothetical protein C8T65DRAFT_19357 [Cerioporus squamosus]